MSDTIWALSYDYGYESREFDYRKRRYYVDEALARQDKATLDAIGEDNDLQPLPVAVEPLPRRGDMPLWRCCYMGNDDDLGVTIWPWATDTVRHDDPIDHPIEIVESRCYGLGDWPEGTNQRMYEVYVYGDEDAAKDRAQTLVLAYRQQEAA